MPSTYTVNLGIEKPATGEQSGTWGDTTNVNFDILDQAINGAARVTLTSAGSSGSPNTLQITNGATSDGRNKWVEFYSSGDLGGSVYVQLDPNDAEKIVFVRNSLASSRSILLFQGTYNSGRDLEVPAGVDMVVKFDGGGASAATVTDVFTKLRATEITTPTLTATTADINGGTIDNSVIGGSTAAAVTGTAVVANTSLNIAGDGATVTGIKDEDNMASNSATKLATQQSIKAYVDSQVGTVDTWAEVLANGATSGSTNPEVTAGQALKTNTINETSAGSGVTIDSVLLKDDVVNATDVETGSISANDGTAAATIANSTGNFTITNFISNSVDIGGGAIDGTVIGGASAAAGSFTTLGASGASSFGADVTITSTDAGTAYGPNFTLRRDSASPADNDFVGRILWQADNDAGENTSYAALHTRLTDVSDGSEDGLVQLDVMVAGTSTNLLDVGASGIVVNDSSVDVDFRVESDSNTHMLFVDGGNNRVGVGTGSPSTTLHLSGLTGSPPKLTLEEGGAESRIYVTKNSPTNSDLRFQTEISGTIADRMIIDYSGAATFSSSITATSLDISGDIDVDGTTNLDVVDIDGAVDMASTLTVGTKIFTGGMTLTNNDSGRIGFNRNPDTGASVNSASLERHQINGANSAGDYLDFQGYNSSGTYVGGFRLDDGALITVPTAGKHAVFNENSNDVDFRIESAAKTHAFFLEGSSSKIGINQSNPAAMIDIVTVDTAGSDAIRIRQPSSSDTFQIQAGISGATNDGLFLNNTNTTGQLQGWKNFEVNFNDDSADRDFRVESNGSTHMLYVDAGNNRVGINDSSPDFKLDVLGVNGDQFRINNGGERFTQMYFAHNNTSKGAIWVDDTDSSFAFYAYSGMDANFYSNTQKKFSLRSSEAVVNEDSLDIDFRVESDTNTHMLFVDGGANNVLLGKSSLNIGVAGAEFRGASSNYFTTSGDTVLGLNRLSSDGVVLEVRKDSSVIGNLAVSSGAYLSVRSNGGNLRLGANNTDYWSIDEYRIYPTTDNVDDIGLANNRVKDLYLSGGVFLGGTGAANKLDDYEEGTWSPAIRGDGSWSAGTQGYTTRAGNYVKVGSFVYLAFDVQVNGLGTVAGSYLQIGNFPFSVDDSNLGGGNVSYYSSLSNTSGPLLMYAASTQGYLMEGGTTYVALSDATDSTRLIGTIMYKTAQ